tara:strand:+ start:485 stop:970 length:486 start_codon:yes stop_codon:yes gene_type:complete
MKHLVNKTWITGSGEVTDFYDILSFLKEYVSKGSKIFIGSDSFNSKNKTCFATAVCLYGEFTGGRYFFFREHIPKKHFNNLSSRVLEETRRSVEIANMLVEEYNFLPSNIELHLDISPKEAGNKTSKYSDMLSGYVQGYGIDFRLKPNAWASQTVADRHSK